LDRGEEIGKRRVKKRERRWVGVGKEAGEE
jgi:hypothetical protein